MYMFGNLLLLIAIIANFSTTIKVLFLLTSKVGQFTYKILLDKDKEKYDVVHMEKLRLAKPPLTVSKENIPITNDPPAVLSETSHNRPTADSNILPDSEIESQKLVYRESSNDEELPRRSTRVKKPTNPYQGGGFY